MRTIKFNVWDIDRRVMYYDVLSLKHNCIEKWASLEVRTSNNVIWLQFIGFLDEDGREIFDGDILRDKNGSTFSIQWFQDDMCFGEVAICGMSDSFLSKEYYKQCKIVGNIYEKTSNSQP